MRLLFIGDNFPSPFAPRKGQYNRHLVRALARQHDVRVICPIPWTAELRAPRGTGAELDRDRCAEVDGVRVSYPRYYYSPKLFQSCYGGQLWWSIASTLKRMLAEFRPDAVLAYWAHPDGEVAVRIGRELEIPSGVIVGGSDVLLITRSASRCRRVAAVLQETGAVIAVSESLRSRAIELGAAAGRTHVWRQGVDAAFHPGDPCEARQRLSLPRHAKIAISVGNFVPVKGLDVLLDACATLKSRGTECHLHLIGSGPLAAQLKGKRDALGLQSFVHFAGPQTHEQLPMWYQAADLTVLSSHSEGLPNVLRESLACGTRFVATRVGGIPEIAGNRTDWLVEPGNSNALADAIEAQLSPADRSLPSNFHPVTWDAAAAEIVMLLHQASRPQPTPEIGSAADGEMALGMK